MLRNTATTKAFYAFDSTTGLPKTGDAANITAYVTIDFGSVTVLADTSAAEMDSTNAPGYYKFSVAAGETDGITLLWSAKSSTSDIVVIGAPAVDYPIEPGFERATRAISRGTVGSASTTTSVVTSSLSPSAVVTDQFKGRIVIFDKDTTTASLRNQATDITGSSSGGVLTVTALTTSPVSGDTFVVQ